MCYYFVVSSKIHSKEKLKCYFKVTKIYQQNCFCNGNTKSNVIRIFALWRHLRHFFVFATSFRDLRLIKTKKNRQF